MKKNNQQRCAVNKLKAMSDEQLQQCCKGQAPGERCCDPKWEQPDPAILSLFDDSWPEALDRARHIPRDNFVQCVRHITGRGSAKNHEQLVEQAIKLWNENYNFRKDAQPRGDERQNTASEVGYGQPYRQSEPTERLGPMAATSSGASRKAIRSPAAELRPKLAHQLAQDQGSENTQYTEATLRLMTTPARPEKPNLFKICNISARGTPLCASCRKPGNDQKTWLMRHLDHAKRQTKARDYISDIDSLKAFLSAGGSLDLKAHTGDFGRPLCNEWSRADTRVNELFGAESETFKRALDGATHIPWEEFLRSVVICQRNRKVSRSRGVSKRAQWRPSDVKNAVEAWEQVSCNHLVRYKKLTYSSSLSLQRPLVRAREHSLLHRRHKWLTLRSPARRL